MKEQFEAVQAQLATANTSLGANKILMDAMSSGREPGKPPDDRADELEERISDLEWSHHEDKALKVLGEQSDDALARIVVGGEVALYYTSPPISTADERAVTNKLRQARHVLINRLGGTAEAFRFIQDVKQTVAMEGGDDD